MQTFFLPCFNYVFSRALAVVLSARGKHFSVTWCSRCLVKSASSLLSRLVLHAARCPVRGEREGGRRAMEGGKGSEGGVHDEHWDGGRDEAEGRRDTAGWRREDCHAHATRKFGAQCAEAQGGHSQVGPSATTNPRVRNRKLSSLNVNACLLSNTKSVLGRSARAPRRTVWP